MILHCCKGQSTAKRVMCVSLSNFDPLEWITALITLVLERSNILTSKENLKDLAAEGKQHTNTCTVICLRARYNWDRTKWYPQHGPQVTPNKAVYLLFQIKPRWKPAGLSSSLTWWNRLWLVEKNPQGALSITATSSKGISQSITSDMQHSGARQHISFSGLPAHSTKR